MKLYTHLGEVLFAFKPLLTFLADAVLHTNLFFRVKAFLFS